MQKVYFRADGNNKIGLGHVIRSLALVNMLAHKFDCFFLIQNPSNALYEEINKSCKIIILPETENILVEGAVINNQLCYEDIIVLDGYFFNTEYQQIIKRNCKKVICIDDIHNYHFIADVIINHSPSASKHQYSYEKYTKFYLGLDYALLRKPFLDFASTRILHTHIANKKVFICLGGADPNNILRLLVKELLILDKKEYEYNIVIGQAYNHFDELKSYLNDSHFNINIYRSLSALEMLSLIKSCSIAICSASSVAIEVLSIGAILFLKSTADNQEEFYNFLLHEGVALPFKEFINLERLNVETILKRQFSLIDGKQKLRYIEMFNNL